MNYKYKLQPYSGRNSRYTCPKCGKHHEFILYVDADTNQPLAAHVGMCNRKDKCGYHYTPSDYFRDNGEIREIEIVPSRPPVTTHFDVIDEYYLQHYYPNSNGLQSNHIIHLTSLFGNERVQDMQIEYMTGVYIDGMIIFWQIDLAGKIRTGKIMQYDPETGHNTGRFNWFHRYLSNPDFILKQCLYGEHLLKRLDSLKPILLVESYKNTHFVRCLTNHFVVVSTDCKGGFTSERCQQLRGRDIIVLPDCGAFDDWARKAYYISREIGCTMRMSTFLEERATEAQKDDGYDIADWIQDQIIAGRSLVDIENELLVGMQKKE